LTQRLYHADAYATDFEARVTSIDPGMSKHAIALDATLFYPESGGQPGDTGTIGGVRIEETIEKGDRILHLTSQKPAFKAGEEVKGSIDWPRRFSNMQQHTGQHILSQAAGGAYDIVQTRHGALNRRYRPARPHMGGYGEG
jgi:alanyl-tRNA synthetase